MIGLLWMTLSPKEGVFSEHLVPKYKGEVGIDQSFRTFAPLERFYQPHMFRDLLFCFHQPPVTRSLLDKAVHTHTHSLTWATNGDPTPKAWKPWYQS